MDKYTEHGQSKMFCNICSRSYKDEDILKDHIERVHEKPRKF